jgi:hypothetical protein
MSTNATMRRPTTTLVIASVLIVIGVLALVGQVAGIELETLIGEETWPFLVIVPGIVLLGLAAVPAPPEGLGFAIAGSVVTTVGGILLFQANTEYWESWAYAWLLVPTAVGLALTVYGALTHAADLVSKGIRLAAVAGAATVVGWWWFETVFQTGNAPVELRGWWPLAIIAVGAVLAVQAVRRGEAR